MAMSHWEEMERPAEWLRRIEEADDGYARLVSESGNLALAAHRLARAKRRVQHTHDGIPTLREVMAAATVIAGRSHAAVAVPPPAILAGECQPFCISDRPPVIRG
jgi:hypothetical protein